jgi:hypothetical protein
MRSDPDVEYRPSNDLMPPDLEPVFYGHDGYRKLWSMWFDAFEDLRWDPEEILDFGDRLLVTARQSGHGSGSGVPMSGQVFQLYKIRRACRSPRRTSPTVTKPSKPQGFRSRRCRRRTPAWATT